MTKSTKDLQQIRKLWDEVKRNITTDNLKLIKAVDALDKYLF